MSNSHTRRLTGLVYLLSLITAILFFYACNNSTPVGSVHTQELLLKNATIAPRKISFSPSSTKDTSVTITLTTTVPDTSGLSGDPHYSISNLQTDSTIAKGVLNTFNAKTSTFQCSYSLKVKTTEYAEFQVNIYGIDKHNQLTNSFRSIITVSGAIGKPPVILYVSNPDTVIIPSGNNVKYFDFKAKVTDPDGQSNIDSVLVNLVSKNLGRALPGSPYMMYDDGSTQAIGNSTSGDAVKGDSVYTRRFQINSSNTPDTLTVYYYAVDKSGLHSDTTKSHLVFKK